MVKSIEMGLIQHAQLYLRSLLPVSLFSWRLITCLEPSLKMLYECATHLSVILSCENTLCTKASFTAHSLRALSWHEKDRPWKITIMQMKNMFSPGINNIQYVSHLCLKISQMSTPPLIITLHFFAPRALGLYPSWALSFYFLWQISVICWYPPGPQLSHCKEGITYSL